MTEQTDIIERLTTLLEERKSANPGSSYVARLYDKGRKKIAEKVGEEAVELVIAAIAQDNKAVIGEAADLLFHLMILLSDRGLSLNDVLSELANREGLSGLAEKAARPSANV